MYSVSAACYEHDQRSGDVNARERGKGSWAEVPSESTAKQTAKRLELADRKKNVYDQDLLALLPIERRVAPASAGTSGVAQPLQS